MIGQIPRDVKSWEQNSLSSFDTMWPGMGALDLSVCRQLLNRHPHFGIWQVEYIQLCNLTLEDLFYLF